MSDGTIIMLPEPHTFSVENVIEVLHAIPGISKVTTRKWPNGEEFCDAEYSAQGYGRVAELLPGRRCFTIHGADDAALEFAVLFANEYRKHSDLTLEVFDEAYFFHQLLVPGLTLASFKKRIADDPFS
jgi:hypothetical protein